MMIKCYTFLFIVLAVISQASAQMVPLVPEPVAQQESLLLQDAFQVQPEILAGGYRQYDLTVARFMTRDDGMKDILIRLVLPPAKPAETDHHYPLVAYVHGGGYIGGSPLLDVTEQRNSFGAALKVLLDDGFAVASLGYRLAREAGWPAQITDVMTGLRFLSLHGNHWKVEGRQAGICGHSAGARLAVLLGTIDQDMFVDQHDPWQDGRYSILSVWMWAGSAWDWPRVDQWVEFGKPTTYSAARLLYGDHPATDDAARHRFRIKASIPHLSMALPPLYKLRPASDYRGAHDDALKTIEVWHALGADATLAIVPGGHNTIGPTDSLLHFFTQHVKDARPSIQQDRSPAKTAEILNDLGEHKAAIEVLVQANTQDHGYTMPMGHWLILHDQSLLWSPNGKSWSEQEQAALIRAKRELARSEAAYARAGAGQTDWFRIIEATSNAMKLGADDPETEALYEHASTALREENETFQLLQKANGHWLKGEKSIARALLRDNSDNRLVQACQRIMEEQPTDQPEWADQWGADVYGQWASISLDHGVWMRFRWVAPGTHPLPGHLHFRNTTSDHWVTEVNTNKGFWLAETETTMAQWYAAMADNADPIHAEDSDHPITMIDYLQIAEWLKAMDGMYPGTTFRLPTEEEWLYAAFSPDHNYPSAMFSAVHAQSSDKEAPGLSSVYHTAPDLNGYYGMLGGVMEWTSSPGHSIAYLTDDDGNRMTIAYPIARGGAWSNMPHSLDPGHRMQHRHGNRQHDLGFRVVVSSDMGSSDWLEQIIKKID